jgi:hypothetical protein
LVLANCNSFERGQKVNQALRTKAAGVEKLLDRQPLEILQPRQVGIGHDLLQAIACAGFQLQIIQLNA